MKKTGLLKSLSLSVCVVLIAVMALFTTGCNDSKTASTPSETQVSAQTVEFTFKVTDADGKETDFAISTDKKTVGEALLEKNLIAGDDSEYGLYVKTVNGITLDYDKDGMYWAFYVKGEFASAGVDSTDISAGAEYAFKAEK